ncbi:MAG TPA: hypothetical protein VFV59_05195 [Candidatus Limnocylindria bacterium]|nr:hypothetical protein [Candidatus Limnocylindria bacterium]HEX2883986.1 hypothetical protein [Candidatus Limnocylindria bacterium]
MTRRALFLVLPFALAVPAAYGLAFAYAGYPLELGPLLIGALGWVLALVLRAPVGLAGLKITGSQESAQRWVVASSGPLEESVRLAALLLVGRDLPTALWLGLGWAAIEVGYAIANGFAMAALASRTDPEAERARAMLPPSAFAASAPWWGVVERIWASALHIGFTLMLAAAPILWVVTVPLHTLTNVTFVRLGQRRSMLIVSGLGLLFGAIILAGGLALHRIG